MSFQYISLSPAFHWLRFPSSISSSLIATVLWLYRPWAISCNASGFLVPAAFLILALLFWNHILICASFNPSSLASSCLRRSVRYLFSENSLFRRDNCSPLKAVRGRFSSGRLSFLLMRRDLGPKIRNFQG